MPATAAGGRRDRSGSRCNTRSITCSGWPSPNGEEPVTANTRVEPSENTSAAGPTAAPPTCSGLTKPGEPTRAPVTVIGVASRARAIPKSTTRGPSSARITLDGLRSRCTMPAAWMAASASARPAPSSSVASGESGPPSSTRRDSGGPDRYVVANHGRGPSTSASITGAV